MRQGLEKISGNYNGFQILLSISVAVAILAEIFTYVISVILRFTCCIFAICFLVGIIVNADKLKQNGWKKSKHRNRVFQIPIYGLLLYLIWASIPIAVKSMIAAISIYTSLSLCKPQNQENNNPQKESNHE